MSQDENVSTSGFSPEVETTTTGVPEAGDVLPEVGDVLPETSNTTSSITPEVKIFYNGQEVIERLVEVNPDGRLCKLADGSTAYVPLTILGE